MAAVHVRLDEGRARPAERVVDRLPRPEEPSQEHLDELGDELAEVGMERVHVLRALLLRQRFLGPRELEVDALVERALRSARHGASLALQPDTPRGRVAVYTLTTNQPSTSSQSTWRGSSCAYVYSGRRLYVSWRRPFGRTIVPNVPLKPAIRRGTTTPFFT